MKIIKPEPESLAREHAGNNLWRSLSAEQQRGVLETYEDSNDELNLISSDEMKAKYKEWPY